MNWDKSQTGLLIPNGSGDAKRMRTYHDRDVAEIVRTSEALGGARMMQGLSDIGAKNAEFARSFLKYEGIRMVGGDLGGERGRRLQFWPVSGRARQSYIASGVEKANRASASRIPLPTPDRTGAGNIDLF